MIILNRKQQPRHSTLLYPSWFRSAAMIVAATIVLATGSSASIAQDRTPMTEPPHPRPPVVVPRDWSDAELRERWTQANRTDWADGNVLTIVDAIEDSGSDVKSVFTVGSLQFFELHRVADSDLWTVSLEIEGLERRACFGYNVHVERVGGPQLVGGPEWFTRRWRGSEVPAPPRPAEALNGSVETVELESEALGARKIDWYRPPGHSPDGDNATLYMTDGEDLPQLAAYLEPLMLEGHLAPLILIGVHSASDPTQRFFEYVPPELAAFHPQSKKHVDTFAHHEGFFLDQVMPWAERFAGATTDRDRRAFWGTSNGADFAIALGLRHPDLFAHIFAFSSGCSTKAPAPTWDVSDEYPIFHLTAGTFETGYWISTKTWADKLVAGHFDHTFEDSPRGHDFTMWIEELVRLLPPVLPDR